MKTETDRLNEAIVRLGEKRKKELRLMKEQLDVTYDSLKPINLIKGLLHEVSASRDIKSGLMSNLLGIGSGLLFKKAFVGASHNPIKMLFGILTQFATTNLVSKNADGIRSIARGLFLKFLKSRKD